MAVRGEDTSIEGRVSELERKMRLIPPGFFPNDPGWTLTEVDDGLHFLYVPTGTVGIEVGTK